MLSPNLAGSLPREFIQNWSDSISKVISLFDTEATRETTNQVLVNAFAAWRPSFLLSDARAVKICFENQLEVLQACLGEDDSARVQVNLARAIGNRISPPQEFWTDFSRIVAQSAKKRRILLRHLSVGVEDATENTEINGIERLQSTSIRLREYQAELVRLVSEEIVNGNRNVIVKLPTGAGKTRVAIESVFELFTTGQIRTVLWIADDKNLCQQAVENCRRYYHNDGSKEFDLILVSFFDGMAKTDLSDIHPDENEALFIVCTPDQLSPNLHFMPNIDVFVMDEAHTSIEERMDLFRETNAKVLLGLSATPPSIWDGQTTMLTPRTSFDATAESTNEFLERTGVLSKAEYVAFRAIDELDDKQVDALFDNKPVDFRHPFILHSILSRLMEDIDNHRLNCGIVYVDRVEQAIVLSNLFNQINKNGYTSAVLYGVMGYQQRRDVIRSFRDGEVNILFNVRLLSEGFDAPNIDGVYLCQLTNPQPGSRRFIQRVGRGLRGVESGGTELCRITTMDFDYE